MWRNQLPVHFEVYLPNLEAFAESLGLLSPTNPPDFVLIDGFVETLSSKLTSDELLETVTIFELFSDFLISRGYWTTHPFCPGFPPPLAQKHASEWADKTPATVIPLHTNILLQPILPSQDPHHVHEKPPKVEITDLLIPISDVSVEVLVQNFFNDRTVFGKKISVGSLPAYRGDYNQFKEFLFTHKQTLSIEGLKAYVFYLEAYKDPREQQCKSSENLCKKPKHRLCTTLSTQLGKVSKNKPCKYAKETSYAKSTISRKKNTLRALIRYGHQRKYLNLEHEWEYILYSPKSDRTPEQPHRALALEEETHKLIRYMASHPELPLGKVLGILISLLCGTRPYELVKLRVFNFEFANNHLHLTMTKNKKGRNVPIPAWIVPMLKDFFRQEQFDDDDYLFPTRQSLHMSQKSYNNTIKAMTKAAGLKRTITAHDLRATCATYYDYYGRESAKRIQEFLGHDDINTTYGYIQSLPGDGFRPTLNELYIQWEALFTTRSSLPHVTSASVKTQPPTLAQRLVWTPSTSYRRSF